MIIYNFGAGPKSGHSRLTGLHSTLRRRRTLYTCIASLTGIPYVWTLFENRASTQKLL